MIKKYLLFGLITLVVSLFMYSCTPDKLTGEVVANSLPTIIGSFKSAVSKSINRIRNTPGTFIWQRNYYEHVIRNDYELNRIREYIIYNPLKWDEDEYNPENQFGYYLRDD